MNDKKKILLILASLAFLALLAVAIWVLLPPGEDTGRQGAQGQEDGQNFPPNGDTGGPFDVAGGAGELNAEQLARIRRMHQKLPGNIFLPPLSDEKDRTRVEKRNHLLNEMRTIHGKLETGRASREERQRYYRFRIAYNRDRMAMLRYVAIRREDGELPEHIKQMIRDLKRGIGDFEKALKE